MAPPNLLTLPLELRQLIYKELFRSYTVRHGFGRTHNSYRAALLQTCKQIYAEAWQFLPTCISLHFRGTEAMLDTLLSVDEAVITRIRHIRVRSFPFPLYASGGRDFYSTYYFSKALSLLPGLQLDQLIVEDSFHGGCLVEGWRDVVTYFDIEELIASDGWKELIYITPNTDFIASGYDHMRRRVAQPDNWNRMLEERDGIRSGAKVQMFIAPMRREERGLVLEEMRPWSAIPGNDAIVDPRSAGPEQQLKGEVWVVARRGRKGRDRVKEPSPERRPWKELKGKEGEFRREGECGTFFEDMGTDAPQIGPHTTTTWPML